MTGEAGSESDERCNVIVPEARRRRNAARAERSGLRLVLQPAAAGASDGGQSREEARLLGAYNLYNG